MPTVKLSVQFAAARKKAGYPTPYALWKATGVSKSTLGSIERGECSPTVETLRRIMGAIGVEVVVTFRPRRKR